MYNYSSLIRRKRANSIPIIEYDWWNDSVSYILSIFRARCCYCERHWNRQARKIDNVSGFGSACAAYANALATIFCFFFSLHLLRLCFVYLFIFEQHFDVCITFNHFRFHSFLLELYLYLICIVWLALFFPFHNVRCSMFWQCSRIIITFHFFCWFWASIISLFFILLWQLIFIPRLVHHIRFQQWRCIRFFFLLYFSQFDLNRCVCARYAQTIN